jgi:hypothetical protein
MKAAFPLAVNFAIRRSRAITYVSVGRCDALPIPEAEQGIKEGLAGFATYPNSAESSVLQSERGGRSSPCATTASQERKPSSCLRTPSLYSKPKGGLRPDRLPSEL